MDYLTVYQRLNVGSAGTVFVAISTTSDSDGQVGGRVGIGTTLSFTDEVSTGTTEAFVRTQNLYFEEHDFQLNDEVVYNANGGTPILVWTAYAKSIAVASFGNFITDPLGVKQNTFSWNI